jgi:hypothetical protein
MGLRRPIGGELDGGTGSGRQSQEVLSPDLACAAPVAHEGKRAAVGSEGGVDIAILRRRHLRHAEGGEVEDVDVIVPCAVAGERDPRAVRRVVRADVTVTVGRLRQAGWSGAVEPDLEQAAAALVGLRPLRENAIALPLGDQTGSRFWTGHLVFVRRLTVSLPTLTVKRS